LCIKIGKASIRPPGLYNLDMMKIAVVFHSATGNTLQVCRYTAGWMPEASFDFFNCVARAAPDPSNYDAVGFATPTFHLGVHPALGDVIRGLPRQDGKPAFLLSTYGMMSGKTMMMLDKAVCRAGFSVFAAHSLSAPESFPPFLAKGYANAEAPTDEGLAGLDAFIARLADGFARIRSGRPLERPRIAVSLLERLIPPGTPAKARKAIGRLSVDKALCQGCGECASSCPRGAVSCAPGPRFDAVKCLGCWACYNRCPRRAILSSAVDGAWRYRLEGTRFASRLPA
jgi:ferredoxin/flavodoxin